MQPRAQMGRERRPLLPEIFRQNELPRQKTATFEVLRANFNSSSITTTRKSTIRAIQWALDEQRTLIVHILRYILSHQNARFKRLTSKNNFEGDAPLAHWAWAKSPARRCHPGFSHMYQATNMTTTLANGKQSDR